MPFPFGPGVTARTSAIAGDGRYPLRCSFLAKGNVRTFLPKPCGFERLSGTRTFTIAHFFEYVYLCCIDRRVPDAILNM